ncbi:MAG: hypothetical protein HQ582_07685 [Planctomycetes bacterium]|nr:hypothetical protein [Planctomycetota bacterium]
MEKVTTPEGHTFGGTPQWDRQTFYWDDLGRRRCISQSGPLSKDGKMLEAEEPCVEDMLYNGEIVVNSKFYPKQTRHGEKPESSKDATGYNPVIIGDAAAPMRSGFESLRNPLEYISNVAFREIEGAIERQAVIVNSTQAGKVVLKIKHGEPKSRFAKSVITVVPEHNWAIESVKSYRSDGGLAREIVYEHKEQTDGLWVPTRGWHTHWGDRDRNATPHFDWRFETSKAIYNDSSFDQHVFDVRLKPDASVADTRYDVTYRIGGEDAVAADLARYAADARKETKNRLPKPTGEVSPAEFGRARQIALFSTIVLLVGCICLFVIARIRRRSH